jgi:hypothetical protein
MFPGKISSPFLKGPDPRIHQGDVFRDIDVPNDQFPLKEQGRTQVMIRTLPYAVVMSQDCDLEWDFENRSEITPQQHDKYLLAVLLCPAYLAAKFKDGNHLDSLSLKMQAYGRELYGQIKSQRNARYHFIGTNQDLAVPDLVIDFKHYFSVPRDWMYGQFPDKYLVSLIVPFRESLSQRFAYYLSRIGLPEVHGQSVDMSCEDEPPD